MLYRSISTAAINFPAPYLIDTEKGAENSQYVEILEKKGGVVFQTSDFDDMVKEVKELMTVKHPYKTLIIDPLTIVYNDLLDRAANKVGTEFGRHYGEANKEMKRLMNLLLRLDMNVIITSHSKKEYGDNLVVLGQTFDCYKKLDYLFDLVVEIQKRPSGRVGLIKKSRFKEFSEMEAIPFSYEEIASRYGKETLERDSKEIELANEDQIAEIKHYIDVLKYPQENIDKWLSKSVASDFSEMNKEDIQKCIDFLKSKINTINSIKHEDIEQ